MKRKEQQKTKDLEAIDPAVLEEILGGAQVAGIDDQRTTGTVIPQIPFNSFFHS